MNFRLDIQGLRALAVVFVILFHIQHAWLPGGFIGVDIFFVISGFLISKSVIDGIDNKKFNFYRFFEGRVKRIVPAYFFMLILSILAAAILFITTDFNTFFHQLKRTILFVSNDLFAKTDNYFGAKSYENPLLHTWSLSIEMQFYLFLPIIVFILPKSWRKPFLVIVFVGILGYTEYNLRIENNKSQMYFSLLARSLEFMIGIGIHFIPKSLKRFNKYKEILSVFALLLILISGFLINENSVFPGLVSLPACLGTAFLIATPHTKINTFLSLPLFAYIGKISYSLYLYHWPVLSLYRYYTMRYDLTALEIIILSFIFTLLSIATFYLMEETYRRMKEKKFILYFSFLSLFLIAFWYLSPKVNKQFFNIPQYYGSPQAFNNKNHEQYTEYELLGAEKLIDDKILLVGDSHSLVMTSFFDIVGKEYNFNFSHISTNLVPAIEGVNDEIIPNEYKIQYYQSLQKSNELISKSNIIIVVKNWHGDQEYTKEMFEKVIFKIRPDQNLIIVSDFPTLERNPFREYKSITKPKKFKRQTVLFPEIPKDIKKLINKNENVYLLELKSEKFFEDAPFYNDTVIYYDERHINKYGSIRYAEFEGHKLAELIEQIKNKN